MKKILLLSTLFTLVITACKNTKEQSQNTPKTKEISTTELIRPDTPDKAIPFITAIQRNDIHTLQKLVAYPLRRPEPLGAIKTEEDFVNRFDEIFDESLKEEILKGKWSILGSKGIMLNNGNVWLTLDGKLLTVNYESERERKTKAALINGQKSTLHSNLREFLTPVIRIKTEKFLLRIDKMTEQNYRYAAWALGTSMSEKPEIIIHNGALIPEGSGGNHRYEFKNKNYTYIIDMNILAADDTPDAFLRVLKDGNEILHQNGSIITK